MEDFLEYRIYHSQFLNVSCDSKQDVCDFIAFGRSFMSNINKLYTDYLWRKDCFHIEPKFVQNSREDTSARIENNSKRSSHLSYFKGTMYYGGDVHDEWFVVHLFYQMSAIYKQIIVQVYDNDGEFLLIHTAYNLPQWISPTNAANRVYIHQNQLHLIPLSYDVTNNVLKSLDLVFNNSINTLANNDIQHCIHRKLEQLATEIRQNPGIWYHSSVVVLPKKCAHILSTNPFMISCIVDGFVCTDANTTNNNSYSKRIKIKPQRKFELDSDDYVFVSVRFTRYLYGMLSSKPLKSAPIYFRKHKFDFKQYRNKSNLNKKMMRDAFLNGIKLMIGFERFYEKCKENIQQNNTDREWIKFKDSLTKKGFFRDYIVSSDAYQTKIESAKTYYLHNMKKKDGKYLKSDESSLCIQNGVHPNHLYASCLNIMDHVPDNKKTDWIKVYDEHVVCLDHLQHDDEDWMNITDNELNELLSEYSHINDHKQQQMLFEEMLNDEEQQSDDDTVAQQQTKDDILSLKESLNTFLDTKSSIDGIEIENKTEHNPEDDSIQFDAERVFSILTAEHAKKLDKERDVMKDMMDAMDDELSEKQKISESKMKEQQTHNEENEKEDEDLNVDLNVVNNILQSHLASQANGGGLGPAATLLSQLGLHLK